MNMIILFIILLVLVILLLWYILKESNKTVNNFMSFKESMDLTELPVVTFYNGNTKLNFLLDTGSNLSHINRSILPSIKYTMVNKSNSVIGFEGNRIQNTICEMTITYKNQEFNNEFCIMDLDKAFATIKEESGVQVHGILGSLFFQRYKYIFDFDSLIAYSKK